MLPLTRLFSYLMVTNLLTQNLPLKGTPDARTPNRDARTPENGKSRRQKREKRENRDERNEKKCEVATPETRKA